MGLLRAIHALTLRNIICLMSDNLFQNRISNQNLILTTKVLKAADLTALITFKWEQGINRNGPSVMVRTTDVWQYGF